MAQAQTKKVKIYKKGHMKKTNQGLSGNTKYGLKGHKRWRNKKPYRGQGR